MNRPRYLADEDLRGSIIKAVRRREPSVEITTVFHEGLASATDDEVLEYAWRNEWIVVSHDVNTMKAAAEKRIDDGPGIHGLFLVAQSKSTRAAAESLVLIWEGSDFEEWKNWIVYLPI